MSDGSVGELAAVTYLDTSDLRGRTVNLMPFWDGERWHLWVRGPNGFVDMRPADAIEVDYVSLQPATDSDLYIPFVDFAWQRASWPDTLPWISAIISDFHNMGTSLAKLKFFFDSQGQLPPGGVSRFAQTEIEHLIVLCRSVFDLLQEMVRCIWSRVELKDPALEAQRRGPVLPSSFAKMVCADNQIQSAEQLASKWQLPLAVAQEYVARAPFFLSLRDARTSVVHGGRDGATVFVTDRGFCVRPDQKPFSDFDWQDSHRHNEDLVSILPWIAHVVFRTIGACNGIMGAFDASIRFPGPIAPSHHVYVRSPASDYLSALVNVDAGNAAWWDEM